MAIAVVTGQLVLVFGLSLVPAAPSPPPSSPAASAQTPSVTAGPTSAPGSTSPNTDVNWMPVATLLAALIAASAATYAATLQRKSGKETAAAAERAAIAAQRSANAASDAVSVSKRSAAELEARSQRDTAMENLRYAIGLSVSEDSGTALMGIKQLRVLAQSKWLDAEGQRYVAAALQAWVERTAQTVEVAASSVTVEVSVPLASDDVMSAMAESDNGDEARS